MIMKRFLNPILVLMLLASISIVPVSCTIDGNDDNPAVTPAEQQGFFSDAINKLIDENFALVEKDGYAELIIPASLYDQSIFTIAQEHKNAMDAIQAAGYKTYVNGGAVRDGILGTPLHDVDFSTDATPEQMAAISIPDAVVVKVMTGGGEIAQAKHTSGEVTDMVPIRGISKDLVGKPTVPADATVGTYSKRLLDDTYSRDLTINSIYYDYKTGDIIDYHGGLHDLRDHVIRTVYDPNVMFPINSSALIRTVRFAARYGFDIDSYTSKAIQDHMHYCDDLGPSLLNFYVTKGFTDGCGQRTYKYYLDNGILGRYVLMLKDYMNKKEYTDRLFPALDYFDEQHAGSISLAIAALFLPCIEDNIGSTEPTQENITALWDKLETESKQKDHFELDDFSGTKTETMTIWYLYKQMTADATLTDAQKTAAIKSNAKYKLALMLLNGYAKTDSSLSKYTDYWK